MIPRRIPRPNRKAASLTAAALLLFVVAGNSQAGWVFVLAAAIVGVVVAGAVLPSFSVRRLDVSRRVPSNSRVGDTISIALELRNRSRNSRTLIEGTDTFLAETPFLAEQIGAEETVTIDYEVTPARRGVHEGKPVILGTGSPFGIRSSNRRVAVESPIVVHPRWVDISSFPLLESASTPHETLHDPRRGAGLEFYGIREYRSGDSLRHVHWRSTARTGTLYVREYEEQPASRLGVLIDAGEKIGEEPFTTFEDAVACAASLVIYALEAGHPAQLFCDSRSGTLHLFEPDRLDMLDWLAGLEADGRRGLARVALDAAGEIHRRSTNVLIFPSTQRNFEGAPEAAAILQERSSRVIAVIVSAAGYGSVDRRVLGPEQEAILAERLATERAVVYRVQKGEDLAQCLREPFLV